MPFTDELWSDAAEIYDEILAHPFIAGLRDGSLHERRFRFYVIQDARYLHEYARALSAVAARAPRPEWTALFAEHAAQAIAVETELHDGLLERLGLTPEDAAAATSSPTTTAYTSYVLATVHGASFAEAVGAVLPCYWIYREVGRALAGQGSPHPLYGDWIATYAGPEFDAAAEAVLRVMDELADDLTAAELQRVRRRFVVCSRYEWMFWDAAWQLETWPVGDRTAAAAA